jgi:hypothetical protein
MNLFQLIETIIFTLLFGPPGCEEVLATNKLFSLI